MVKIDIMKTKNILVFLIVLLFAACESDKLPDFDRQQPVGLGGEDWGTSESDIWIYNNLTQPYNIDVKYRWDQSEVDLNKTLVPIKEELVVPLLRIVKRLWIEPYEQQTNDSFIKKLSPKRYVLVGSAKYKETGITIGEAEGGRKIVLYRCNDFEGNLNNREMIQAIMKTAHHEFGHTMHQIIMYPLDFNNVTPGSYTSSWENASDDDALKLGYISRYSRANPNEDFVEIISRVALWGQDWFDEQVARAKQLYEDPATNAGLTYDPAEALRAKESIIVNYLKSNWGVDFYDTDEREGLVTLVQRALDNITQ